MLVTGSKGQLGTALKEKVTEFTGLDLEDADIEADISQEDVIEKIMDKNPEVIVHTAAITDLDFAEKNPERVREVNVEGTENIVKAAEKADAHLIYISTDYVFEGELGDYSEEDNPNPQSVYARTKYKAEKAVRDSSIDYTIFRPSVVFHEDFDNFFTWAKNKIIDDGEVPAVTDQICCPTYAPNLAEVIIEAAEKGVTGTFHATGNTKVSRYEAVQIMKEELGLDGEIEKIKMEDIPWKAERPADSSLCISKLKNNFETEPLSLYQAFEEFKGEKL